MGVLGGEHLTIGKGVLGWVGTQYSYYSSYLEWGRREAVLPEPSAWTSPCNVVLGKADKAGKSEKHIIKP